MPSTMPTVRKNHDSSDQRRTGASHSALSLRVASAATA
jgi:hypothetical protein